MINTFASTGQLVEKSSAALSRAHHLSFLIRTWTARASLTRFTS
jgi:hypothetical protein